jgi:ribonuclease HI
MSDERKWVMHFDGSSSKSFGSGTRVTLRSPGEKTYYHQSKITRSSTCNQAEYAALLLGLEEAKRIGVKNLEVRRDSKLVCCQVSGEWEYKAEYLKPMREKAVELSKEFDNFEINHIPCDENQRADHLAKSSVFH